MRSKPLRAPADRGTPETRRKLTTDVIYLMHRRGSLTADHVRAAEEIRSIAAAIGRHVSLRASDPSRPLAHGVGGAIPLGAMTRREHDIYIRRFGPWRDHLAENLRIRKSQARVVLSVILDNETLASADRALRARHGTAAKYVGQALRLYCNRP